MVERVGPKCGYDFGSKRQYRRQVWSIFERFVLNRGMPRKCAQALLMPSIEGSEIDVALSHGFQERNLHVVDRNPAIVATLKRRYPRINTYGVDLERALLRVGEAGVRLDCINADLTWSLGGKTLNALRSMIEFDAVARSWIVSVTMLRGRDSTEIREEFENNAPYSRLLMAPVSRQFFGPPALDSDYLRIAYINDYLCNELNLHVCPVGFGIYKSEAGKQTMLFVAMRGISERDYRALKRSTFRLNSRAKRREFLRGLGASVEEMKNLERGKFGEGMPVSIVK